MTETNCYSQAFANAVLNSDDCMDDQVTVYPGAPEICDDFDNNCDGDINEDLTFVVYYIDNDGDTYGAGSAGDFCNDPGIGYTLDNTDCNDDDASLYLTDTLFVDADLDGYDAGTAELCIGMTIPSGYIQTSLGSDCVDTNNLINPGAVDVLGDAIDQNCDGIVDGYVGLNDISANTFSISPNPGNDFIHINSTLTGVLEIRNIEGKVMRQVSFDNNTTINMSDVANGIYFISLNQQTIKWLKQ